MIVVDPRFTRTASTADLFLQIRAGTDIAFLGGLINYAIANDRVAKEAIYYAAGIDHVRVEACEWCRRYIKTVDLTKDGRAVPVVDELATIPLSLWAAEHGYLKCAANLLGL